MLSLVKKIRENNFSTQFWTLIGPFFLIISLFLTCFSDVSNKDLFLHSIVGIILCLKNKKRGLLVSLLFLCILTLIKHHQISQHFLQFGIEFSLALGFIITYHSFEYISENMDQDKKSFLDNVKEKEELEEKLRKDQDFHMRQKKSLQEEIALINFQMEEKNKENAAFKEQAESFREKITALEKEKEEVLSNISLEKQKHKEEIIGKLKEMEKEKEESFLLNQNLNKILSKEKEEKKEIQKENFLLKEKLANSKEAPVSSERLKNLESLYKQLRNQFDEKKSLLNQTRKELFHSKEKLKAFYLEKEREKSQEPSSVRRLQEELGSFEKVLQKYQEENRLQQELISELTEKLKSKNLS